MSKRIAAIYIPGLGDQKSRGQDKAIWLLRLFGIKPHYFAFGWAESGDFEKRLNELLGLVGKLRVKGYSVHFIAASAGASGALNAFAANSSKVASISLICGKINNPNSIGPGYFNRNPRFAKSMQMLPTSLNQLSKAERAKIMSIRPIHDSVVPPRDTIIEGANNLKSFTFGHSSTIAHYLTLGTPRIAWWIRRNS